MSLYQESLIWDQALIDRYDLSGPRYTSYPTAPQFLDDFAEQEWHAAVARSNSEQKPLSLYFHIPFCDTLCFYCACNKVVTRNRSRAMAYLKNVEREMALQAQLFDPQRTVSQLHWGGGTPSYISEEEMTWLMQATARHFRLLDTDEGEYSVEIHPARMPISKLVHMRELGFNRLSMGVQDFNSKVQEAVNRYNSVEQVSELMSVARAQGYHSISMDLIYGLPFQTRASVTQTLNQVIDLAPDRLSLFNYAHLPHLFKSQRLIKTDTLPQAEEKLDILHSAIDQLQRAGYVYIGMDHFAKPDDSLVIAQQQGRMQRNFQGYSTHAECDLLAFGVSSISYYGGTYVQNVKTLNEYHALIEQGQPALQKGVRLTREDHLRRWIINQLTCHFELDFNALAQKFAVQPEEHLAAELATLQPMIEDGLIERTAQGLRVLNRGRLLIRRVCMAFDQYLAQGSPVRYSKVI
ncbi:oxygen-independent coproporphyrinogen III oxidase [Gilvimarinus sp. 1_MG-2023]|uniref:oxygen-independent coproporphyrinogen III oxidase n=1 Tax=Gilvimarinus sp. 1_MG-2023 TaxID=3062638 RepID=UPI0026E38BF2|nr:oxygen-independent coproporphyrinogen III oxidase [Gilvimarinus sp. 1_MG-2023]MDO6746226.1 oxygen-independent coproporphyrinogen III oxidase [Gilvimarinus sp. 1_MG-2023]